MLRSELIEILQKTTRDCQRDGEVLMTIILRGGPGDGLVITKSKCPGVIWWFDGAVFDSDQGVGSVLYLTAGRRECDYLVFREFAADITTGRSKEET